MLVRSSLLGMIYFGNTGLRRAFLLVFTLSCQSKFMPAICGCAPFPPSSKLENHKAIRCNSSLFFEDTVCGFLPLKEGMGAVLLPCATASHSIWHMFGSVWLS